MDKSNLICYIGVDGAATVIGLKSHNRERETRFSPPSLNRGKARTMTDRMMQFFAYEHLPAHLQAVSKPFGDLAKQIVETLPANAERTAGLRKLLEAKDCAVRALLYKDAA